MRDCCAIGNVSSAFSQKFPKCSYRESCVEEVWVKLLGMRASATSFGVFFREIILFVTWFATSGLECIIELKLRYIRSDLAQFCIFMLCNCGLTLNEITSISFILWYWELMPDWYLYVLCSSNENLLFQCWINELTVLRVHHIMNRNISLNWQWLSLL